MSVEMSVKIKVFTDRLYISNGGTLPEDWTKEKLLGNHQSVPHNPGIANTFFKAGYVESWGRGIQKILSSCEEYDIPHPEYEVLSSSVTIYFSNPGVSENTRVEPRGKTSEKTSEKILQVIQKSQLTTIAELAELIGVSTRSIERNLQKLQKEKKLKRIGSDRGGYWEIIVDE